MLSGHGIRQPITAAVAASALLVFLLTLLPQESEAAAVAAIGGWGGEDGAVFGGVGEDEEGDGGRDRRQRLTVSNLLVYCSRCANLLNCILDSCFVFGVISRLLRKEAGEE